MLFVPCGSEPAAHCPSSPIQAQSVGPGLPEHAPSVATVYLSMIRPPSRGPGTGPRPDRSAYRVGEVNSDAKGLWSEAGHPGQLRRHLLPSAPEFGPQCPLARAQRKAVLLLACLLHLLEFHEQFANCGLAKIRYSRFRPLIHAHTPSPTRSACSVTVKPGPADEPPCDRGTAAPHEEHDTSKDPAHWVDLGRDKMIGRLTDSGRSRRGELIAVWQRVRRRRPWCQPQPRPGLGITRTSSRFRGLWLPHLDSNQEPIG